MQVVLSLGSNIEREQNIRFAIAQLYTYFDDVVLSPVYETEAVGFEGPSFYNLVAQIDSDLSVAALLEILHKIESGAGRLRGAKSYGSRTLDIDILLYGDHDLRAEGRNIPRDEIDNAAYVLRPLADILPDGRHPISGERYAQLWAQFDQISQQLEAIEFALPA